MKRSILIGLFFIAALFSCKKSGDNNVANNSGNTGGPVTTGNTTNYNGYIVKTVSVSQILLNVDNTDKLTVAQLYGGGNKVIFKPGSSNTIELGGSGGYSVLPSGFPPDGNVSAYDAPIDNGKLADTSGGNFCVKIKGFDKAKKGYNQLNIVMYKLIRANPPGTAGYFDNVVYMGYNSSRKNTDYSGTFFKSLFTGSIDVADVEMAAPLANNPYITEDEIIFNSQALGSIPKGTVTDTRFYSNTYGVHFDTTPPYNFSFGGPYKYEWVNANTGTITKYDDYDYTLYFPNILDGNVVVMPSDTTSKVFLRVTGFNPAITGFNQLRLFFAESGKVYDGGMPFITVDKPLALPTLLAAKNAFIPQGLYCVEAAPNVPHY